LEFIIAYLSKKYRVICIRRSPRIHAGAFRLMTKTSKGDFVVIKREKTEGECVKIVVGDK
jgi:hypothetical protein